MQGIEEHEYSAFVASIEGLVCVNIVDGDYDRAVVFPTGLAIPVEYYRCGMTSEDVVAHYKRVLKKG